MANGAAHGISAEELTGLTRDQAARQLTSDGPNELPGSGPRSLLSIARQVLAEPMFLFREPGHYLCSTECGFLDHHRGGRGRIARSH